jgi:hypothetical protein
MGEALKGPSRITQVRRHIQKAFAGKSKTQTPSGEQEPEMAEWKEVSESEEDLVSLIKDLWLLKYAFSSIRLKNRLIGIRLTVSKD